MIAEMKPIVTISEESYILDIKDIKKIDINNYVIKT